MQIEKENFQSADPDSVHYDITCMVTQCNQFDWLHKSVSFNVIQLLLSKLNTMNHQKLLSFDCESSSLSRMLIDMSAGLLQWTQFKIKFCKMFMVDIDEL